MSFLFKEFQMFPVPHVDREVKSDQFESVRKINKEQVNVTF